MMAIEAPTPQKALSTYADHGISGEVELFITTPGLDTGLVMDEFEQQRFQLTFDEGWRLLQSLTGALSYLSEQRMRNAVAGDCATCGNHRMITVVKNVRPESIHCPDCYDTYRGATPAYPTLKMTADA